MAFIFKDCYLCGGSGLILLGQNILKDKEGNHQHTEKCPVCNGRGVIPVKIYGGHKRIEKGKMQ